MGPDYQCSADPLLYLAPQEAYGANTNPARVDRAMISPRNTASCFSSPKTLHEMQVLRQEESSQEKFELCRKKVLIPDSMKGFSGA